MRNGRVILAVLLIVVGLAGIAVGIMYLTVVPHLLPSFFPGYTTHLHKKTEYKKGTAGVVAGVVLLVVAGAVIVSGRGRRSRRWH
jgi:hypothetical protein